MVRRPEEGEIDFRPFPHAIAQLAKTFVRPAIQSYPSKEIRACCSDLLALSPDAVKSALPASSEDGFISPTALQLALALGKPDVSGVSAKGMVGQRSRELAVSQQNHLGDSVKTMKARWQMERAERGIERRRWIEWYRRNANAR
jgi:hypothetical protein